MRSCKLTVPYVLKPGFPHACAKLLLASLRVAQSDANTPSLWDFNVFISVLSAHSPKCQLLNCCCRASSAVCWFCPHSWLLLVQVYYWLLHISVIFFFFWWQTQLFVVNLQQDLNGHERAKLIFLSFWMNGNGWRLWIHVTLTKKDLHSSLARG